MPIERVARAVHNLTARIGHRDQSAQDRHVELAGGVPCRKPAFDRNDAYRFDGAPQMHRIPPNACVFALHFLPCPETGEGDERVRTERQPREAPIEHRELVIRLVVSLDLGLERSRWRRRGAERRRSGLLGDHGCRRREARDHEHTGAGEHEDSDTDGNRAAVSTDARPHAVQDWPEVESSDNWLETSQDWLETSQDWLEALNEC